MGFKLYRRKFIFNFRGGTVTNRKIHFTQVSQTTCRPSSFNRLTGRGRKTNCTGSITLRIVQCNMFKSRILKSVVRNVVHFSRRRIFRVCSKFFVESAHLKAAIDRPYFYCHFRIQKMGRYLPNTFPLDDTIHLN